MILVPNSVGRRFNSEQNHESKIDGEGRKCDNKWNKAKPRISCLSHCKHLHTALNSRIGRRILPGILANNRFIKNGGSGSL